MTARENNLAWCEDDPVARAGTEEPEVLAEIKSREGRRKRKERKQRIWKRKRRILEGKDV